MPRKKRAQPFDPAASAREALEREESRAEVSRLRAQPSTAVNACERTGRLKGAWRLNCFNTLLQAGSPAQEAVCWLDGLIRLSLGDVTPERRLEVVHSSASGWSITDAMLTASESLERVRENMAPNSFRMLTALLHPDASLLTRWRDTVKDCTGETDERAQAARVRAACENLAWVRERMPSEYRCAA